MAQIRWNILTLNFYTAIECLKKRNIEILGIEALDREMICYDRFRMKDRIKLTIDSLLRLGKNRRLNSDKFNSSS